MTLFRPLVTLPKTFRFAVTTLIMISPLAGNQSYAQSPCTLTDSISISTGYNQGYTSPVSIGATDSNWRYSAATTALMTAASVSASGPLYRISPERSWAGSSAGWVSCTTSSSFATVNSTDTNLYTMEVERTFRTCISDSITIKFQVYADNYVNALWIDNVLQSFRQPSTAVTTNYTSGSSFSRTFLMSPGTHSIRMRVGNYPVAAALNYFGIMVDGNVRGKTNSIVGTGNSGNCVCQTPRCGKLNKLNISTDPVGAPYVYTFDLGLSPASTQWAFNFGDGSPVSTGTGSTSLVHTYSGPMSTSVTVEIYDANGQSCGVRAVKLCMDSNDGKDSATLTAKGEQKQVPEESFAPYPNPTRTSLIVPLKGMNGEVSASIIARDGKVLLNKKGLVQNDTKWEFDTADLLPGVYVISVTCANGTKATTFQKL